MSLKEGTTSPSADGRLDPLARVDGAAHVEVGRQVEVRRGRLRLGHPPGDGLLELASARTPRRCRARSPASPWRRGSPRRAARSSRGAASSAAAGASRPLDVGLDDPPARARTRRGRRGRRPLSRAMRRASGDALTLSPSPSEAAGARGSGSAEGSGPGPLGRNSAAAVVSIPRQALRRPRRLRSEEGVPGLPVTPSPAVSPIADRDHLADRQRRPLLGDDLGQRPGDVGLVDHVRLVGLDLDQLVADRHLVADRLHPAEDRCPPPSSRRGAA